MKTNHFKFATLLLTVGVFAHAQRVNTQYVTQFPGTTVAAKTAAAQAACNSAVPCVLIFDADLSVYPVGSLPGRGGNESWWDYYSHPGQTYYNGSAVGGGSGSAAGATADVQINTGGAFDADSGIFTYSKANHQLQIGATASTYVGNYVSTQNYSDNGPHRIFENAATWTPGASASGNGACGFCDDSGVNGSNAADHWASFQVGNVISGHVANILGFSFAPTVTYSGAAVRAIEIQAISGGVTPSSNRAIHIAADTTRDWTFVSDSLQKSYMAGPIAVNGAVDPTVSSSGLYVTGTATIGPRAFSSLPACSGTTEGSYGTVTDSTTGVQGQTVTGGGTNHIFAYCNGTHWVVDAGNASTSTVATGTSAALSTSAQASGSCTAVTQSGLSGLLSTDSFLWAIDSNVTNIQWFNILPQYVSATSFTFNVCNISSVSETLGGTVHLVWRVVR